MLVEVKLNGWDLLSTVIRSIKGFWLKNCAFNFSLYSIVFKS